MAYEKLLVDEQFAKIGAELQHVTRLEEAARMWDEARAWIDDKLVHFQGELRNLCASGGRWEDEAGKLFAAHAEEDLKSLRSWTQATREVPGAARQVVSLGPSQVMVGFGGVMTIPTVQSTTTYSSGITLSGVAGALRKLAADIQTTYNNVKFLHDDFHRKYDDKPLEWLLYQPRYQKQIGDLLTTLAAEYVQLTSSVLPNAIGAPWTGPRTSPSERSKTPSSTGPGADPAAAGPAGTPGAADPAAVADPGQDTGSPRNPAEDRGTTASLLDSGSSLLDSGSKALDSASQLLQQLGGTGAAGLPGGLDGALPGELSPLSSLPGLASADNPSGLPSLAGLDAGSGGIGSGGATIPSAAAPATGPGTGASPLPGAPSAAGGVAGAAAAGTAGVGGGMMPAMHQPHAGGGGSSGGIRPGAAEQVNAVRSRKPEATPGVALRGRAGRANGAVTPPAPPAGSRRRWDTENTTVQLLDEELWQVNPTENEPEYRAGH